MMEYDASLDCIMKEGGDGHTRASAIQTMCNLLVCVRWVIIGMEAADSMKEVSSLFSQSIGQSETNIYPHAIIGGNVNTIYLNLLNYSLDVSRKVCCRLMSVMCLQGWERNLLLRRGILPFWGGKYFLRHIPSILG